MLALFAVLGLFFLTPPFALTIQRPTILIQFLPSYWFTGLLLELKGNRDPKYAMLAGIALRNLSIAVASATVLYLAAWIRNVRRIAEAPDIAPSTRRFPAANRSTVQFCSSFGVPLPAAVSIVCFSPRMEESDSPWHSPSPDRFLWA
jgi:hypothetical protein